MENAQEGGAGEKSVVTADVGDSVGENSNTNPPLDAGGVGDAAPSPAPVPPPVSAPARPSRTPFTSLSQVDADLALARALQEQERAYMMLSMNGAGAGGGFHLSDSESYEYEEEEEEDELMEGNHVDGHNPDHPIEEGEAEENGEEDEDEDGDDDEEEDEDEDEDEEGNEEDHAGSDYGEDELDADIDPADFEDDEAYARALQDAEEREVASRLMALAGLEDWESDNHGGHGNNSQDAWQEVDPDHYSYEELMALGDVVGTETRGLSADKIASLPSMNYKAENVQDGNVEQCVICRLEFEDGDSLVVLSCKHRYHPDCINQWLQINKVCPVCSTEVSTSENKQN